MKCEKSFYIYVIFSYAMSNLFNLYTLIYILNMLYDKHKYSFVNEKSMHDLLFTKQRFENVNEKNSYNNFKYMPINLFDCFY